VCTRNDRLFDRVKDYRVVRLIMTSHGEFSINLKTRGCVMANARDDDDYKVYNNNFTFSYFSLKH